MAVGVETISLLRPSTSVIARVTAPTIRHFAKPPGVMRNLVLDFFEYFIENILLGSGYNF